MSLGKLRMPPDPSPKREVYSVHKDVASGWWFIFKTVVGENGKAHWELAGREDGYISRFAAEKAVDEL